MRILLELRIRLQNHVILIQLRVESIDLPLTESIVECVVDGFRGNPETGSRGAIDRHRRREAAQLLIRHHVGQLRQLLQL